MSVCILKAVTKLNCYERKIGAILVSGILFEAVLYGVWNIKKTVYED